MDLSISGVSAYQQSQTLGQVQVAVDAKILNIAKQQGAAALQLVQSATGETGSSPAAVDGLGNQFDAYA